jgi:hypothetical protein
LFGSASTQPPAIYNKILPHLDQLTSFLYSAETTRFSINTGAAVNPMEQIKVPTLTRALNDKWLDSNADQVFSTATTWALVYNSTFVKLIINKGQIQPFMVEPQCVGVLREDSPYTDRQEALVQTYYITKSELYNRLYSHPQRDAIVRRLTLSRHERTEVANGMERILMSRPIPSCTVTSTLICRA